MFRNGWCRFAACPDSRVEEHDIADGGRDDQLSGTAGGIGRAGGNEDLRGAEARQLDDAHGSGHARSGAIGQDLPGLEARLLRVDVEGDYSPGVNADDLLGQVGVGRHRPGDSLGDAPYL